MTDTNDKDNAKRARALYLDGETIETIAATLERPLEWVRTTLGLDGDADAAKPKSETPPAPAQPYRSPASENIFAAAAANRILQQACPGRDFGGLGPGGPPAGYEYVPGGGRYSDGSRAVQRIPGYVPSSAAGGRSRRGRFL